MGTVFVVQENERNNILSANEHGDLKLLLQRNRQITLDPSYVIGLSQRELAGFSNDDAILAQGDPAAIGIVCYLASRANNGRFNILKWINTDHAYTSLEVDTQFVTVAQNEKAPDHSRVFVCQETSLDLSLAERFGKLETLVKSDRDAILSVSPVVRQASRKLANFGDNDHLLLIGDPVVMGVMASLALTSGRGRAKFLKWDRKQSTYYSIQIDLSRK